MNAKVKQDRKSNLITKWGGCDYVPEHLKLAGDVKGKTAIALADGRTIVFTKNAKNVAEIKERYENLVSYGNQKASEHADAKD